MVASPGGNQEVAYALSYLDAEEWITQESNILPVAKDEQTLMIILKSNSELFRSSFGGARGFLQIVTLRRGPREGNDVALISEAEEAAAIKEAERVNRENDKNVSREQKRVQPKQQ
jgi:hypothetical protein